MFVLLTALLFQSASQGGDPPQACFAIVADAEGEMGLAEDADWRAKALARTRTLWAATQSRAKTITAELKGIEKAKAALYADYQRGEIEEDDFTSARSELETRFRALVEEKETPLLQACGS